MILLGMASCRPGALDALRIDWRVVGEANRRDSLK